MHLVRLSQMKNGLFKMKALKWLNSFHIWVYIIFSYDKIFTNAEKKHSKQGTWRNGFIAIKKELKVCFLKSL